MKRVIIFIPFILFCALTLYFEDNKNFLERDNFSLAKNYTEGVLNSEYYGITHFSDYKISANLDTESKTLSVKEKIVWVNKSFYPTNQIWLKLDANSLKSNNTEYTNKNYITPSEETGFVITKILVNNKPYNLIYQNTVSLTQNDSTSAKIILDSLINSNDSVNISIEYNLKVPSPTYGLGYAKNREFYFFTDWFIKVAVFNYGKWYNYPTPSYINYFSEFSKFNINLTVPKGYYCGASAKAINKDSSQNKTIYTFKQSGIHDFVWFTAQNIVKKEYLYKRKNQSPVFIYVYAQPEKERHIDRYIKIINSSLQYLESELGVYPYQSLTVVDLPRTYSNLDKEYPNLIAVKSALISPVKTQQPEYEIAKHIAHQYFYGIVANNEIIDPWLDEGFSKFFASKIVENYYGKGYSNFNLVTYMPVFGLNIFSYNEIPLIYSLGDFPYSPWEANLLKYYNNNSVGAISNNVYEFPNSISYQVMSSIKPELMLLSLEKYLGKAKFKNVVYTYYNRYKFKHPSSKDFINIVKRKTNDNLNWFFNNLIENSSSFDYKIKYVKKVKKNEYEVYAERLGDGVFFNKVALYTTKDTLYNVWNDDKKWKIFRFSTNNEVIGAEIDPERINYLDINFANNSYLVNSNYLITFSLAVRWFFWIQNALMIMGSIV